MHLARTAHLTRRWALGAAVLLTGLAVLPIGAAGATDSLPADLLFNGAATAIGSQVMVDSNPEPLLVPDVADLQLPVASSVFSSTGDISGTAHLANGNGIVQVPGLACLSGTTCSDLNNGLSALPGHPTVPPADPTVAQAAYPSPQHADAPTVGGSAVPTTFGNADVSVTVGHASADAAQTEVASSATSTATQTPLIIGGAATTSTTQRVSKGKLLTTARASVNDITIGELVQIANVTAVADVSSAPGQAVTDASQVTASGVSVHGVGAATLDKDGLHVPGMDVDQVKGLLLSVGITDIHLIGVTSSTDDSGYAASAAGVSVSFDTNVDGVPAPSLPAAVVQGCESVAGPDGALGPITGKLPVNACNGVGVNANAEYYGTVVFGQAGVLNLTASSGSTTGFTAGSGATNSPAATTPAGPNGTAGQNGGTAASGALPAGTGTLSANPDEPPALAANGGGPAAQSLALRGVALGEDLRGLRPRLVWLFPASLFAGLAMLAGRYRKVPARIPRSLP